MARRALIGFVAGFVATLVFHQGAIWLLAQFIAFPFGPWNMGPNAYGVPVLLALSFWAGVWGVLLAWLLAARPALPPALTGLVLGSIVPSVWGWTAIAGMRGAPLFAGGNTRVIVLVLVVNAVWGLATALLIQFLRGTWAERTHRAA